MKKESDLPPPVETYIWTINAGDANGLQATFAEDAIVKDAGREMRGVDAILKWASHDIFAVQVRLEVMKVVEDQGQTIVTAKIDGTFDRTGLPDPFLMDHGFKIARGKIAALTIKLTPRD
jgi:ketosteroid isomerase-like protein